MAQFALDAPDVGIVISTLDPGAKIFFPVEKTQPHAPGIAGDDVQHRKPAEFVVIEVEDIFKFFDDLLLIDQHRAEAGGGEGEVDQGAGGPQEGVDGFQESAAGFMLVPLEAANAPVRVIAGRQAVCSRTVRHHFLSGCRAGGAGQDDEQKNACER